MTNTNDTIKIIRITTVASSLKGLLKGQLAFMNKYYEVVGISSDVALLEQAGQQEGIRTKEVPMTRKITPLKDLIALWKLYRIFRKERPQIVHTHTPKAGTLGLMAAWLARVPHRLHTIAGLPLMEAEGAKRTLLNTVEKITYACATKVYPNSQGLYTFILEQRFTRQEKLKVIGQGSSNGINTAHFDPIHFTQTDLRSLRNQLNLSSKERVLLFLGRMVADKGIHELIDAFVAVSKIFPNTTLLLGGEYERDLDPLLPATEEIINQHPKIKALGHLNDVRPYLALSEVFVFPSYREGFPNVVMQAGAMGIPSIVSDINGCNEIIIPSENGIIVPPKDTQALTLAIVDFLRTGQTTFNAAHCRKLICDRYDQKLIWTLLHKEYDALLA